MFILYLFISYHENIKWYWSWLSVHLNKMNEKEISAIKRASRQSTIEPEYWFIVTMKW